MYDVSLDDCVCACNNANIIHATTTKEILIWSTVLFLIISGIIYFIYWSKKKNLIKGEKYIEVRVKK